jgi:transposase-like protein
MARSLRPRPPPRATRRSLPGIELVARYLDAIYLPVRPTGTKEGVLCAWGIDNGGRRVLIDVCLGMRESEQDWLELGRGLTARGWRLLAGPRGQYRRATCALASRAERASGDLGWTHLLRTAMKEGLPR